MGGNDTTEVNTRRDCLCFGCFGHTTKPKVPFCNSSTITPTRQRRYHTIPNHAILSSSGPFQATYSPHTSRSHHRFSVHYTIEFLFVCTKISTSPFPPTITSGYIRRATSVSLTSMPSIFWPSCSWMRRSAGGAYECLITAMAGSVTTYTFFMRTPILQEPAFLQLV